MSDRAKKSIGQDAVGVLFCLLGGFFLVSIYLNWQGNEPVVALATQPVLELVALLGPVPAALFSLGVAAIGAWIFLASHPPAIGRPLGALALGAAALALILGAFALGGSLGDVFPSLVAGTAGRLIGAVLGVAGAFLAFTLVAPRGAPASPADVMRAGIGGRAEFASGVSSAEAALLVSEPRPAARREAPLRDETLRPLAPEKARAAAPATRPLEVKPTPPPAASAAELPRPTAPAWEAGDEAEEEPEAPAAALAVPSREDELDVADEDEADEELASELAEALHADESKEEEEEEAEEAAPAVLSTPNAEPLSAERTPPSASWEQVSLFDEPEAEEEEAEEAASAPAATGTLDFGEPARPTHEPEQGNADDPFAAAPFVVPAPAAAAPIEPDPIQPDPVESDPVESEEDEFAEDELAPEEAEELAAELADDEEEPLEDEESAEPEEEPAQPVQAPVVAAQLPLEPARPVVTPEPARAAAPAPKPAPAPAPEFVLQPKAAPRSEPEVAREGGDDWQKLVFDSGLLILEQKRVAVSMLERRFGIDFDSACRVLDELQQAGLIGPYIGGRTREILLTQEQWQAQAAETA